MDQFISSLKLHNKLINIIRCQPNITKSTLSEHLKLSWPTVASNIETLNKYNVFCNENGLKINPDCAHMIGLSVGAAQIKLTIIDMNFEPINNDKFTNIIESLGIFLNARNHMKENQKKISNYIYFDTPDNLFELQIHLDSIMEDLIKIIENQNKFDLNIISLGIAFTGVIDNKNKKIIKSHNLEYISDRTLNNIIYPNRLDYFEQKNINIYIDNNSNTAVVAEKYHMYLLNTSNYKYHNKENIMSFYLGTGIGAGMILNNKLYHGATNFVGEVGHLEVPQYPGKTFKNLESCCSCGSCTCIDYRIRNDVFEMTKVEFSKLDSEKIKKYFVDHPDKLEIFSYYLGKIVNLSINILNLDIILFTGKFKEVTSLLWPLLYKQINSNKLFYIANECKLISSDLGATSPSIGVAICAYFDRIKEDIEW